MTPEHGTHPSPGTTEGQTGSRGTILQIPRGRATHEAPFSEGFRPPQELRPGAAGLQGEGRVFQWRAAGRGRSGGERGGLRCFTWFMMWFFWGGSVVLPNPKPERYICTRGHKGVVVGPCMAPTPTIGTTPHRTRRWTSSHPGPRALDAFWRGQCLGDALAMHPTSPYQKSHVGVPNLEDRGSQLLHSLRDKEPPRLVTPGICFFFFSTSWTRWESGRCRASERRTRVPNIHPDMWHFLPDWSELDVSPYDTVALRHVAYGQDCRPT